MKDTCEHGKCLIEIKDLNIFRGSHTILKDVSLDLICGQMTAIIGPNGAGKTTLVKAILGEVPFSGKIIHMHDFGPSEKKPTIGYVPQSLSFENDCPVSVKDLFYTVGGKKNKRRMEELLAISAADNLCDRKLSVLSGGELQRVLLALALFPETPELLILDEPVSGVDLAGQELFYQLLKKLLKEEHTSILMVSHDFNMVKTYADKVCLISGKVQKSGTPNEVFASAEFKKIFMLGD